jgi:Ca-activated chloride channel homolog
MTTPAKQQSGLFVQGDARPIPLTGVKVRAEIASFASRVTLTQGFRNAEPTPIEAVYVFPLPENAAVSMLAMRVGDRRIEGHVEEREKAFETYDEALQAGHGAVLLDQERPNIFTASVGNVLPGQEVVVELTWVAELPFEGEALRFLLPTTVAPRYAPATDRAGVSPTPAERVSPPVALEVPYGVEITVDVDAGGPLRAVESPSHAVRVELDGDRARVTLTGREAAMDRDFVLRVVPQRDATPWLRLEKDPHGELAAAVAFVPRLEATATRSEVVFLVDRSGSMGGSSIEEVRRALQLCLRSLKEGDAFNIVGFGSTFEALWPAPRPYDDDSLDEASHHVDHLEADLGGTEILPALDAVLKAGDRSELACQVVLLTDGEVSNEAAVIELAGASAGRVRIFTFGIGHGCSEYLVRSLARVSGGAAEMIFPGERIEPKVLRQFARLATPRLADITVSWGGAKVTRQAPATPPAVFSGEPLLVWAHLGSRPKGEIELSGTVDGRPVRFTVPVADNPAKGDMIATLAARAAIRDLEEGTAAAQRGGSQQRERKQHSVDKAILDLALEYGLLSSRTSMVAVEIREGVKDHRAPELRRVPVALTHGWGGVADARPAPGLAKSVMPPVMMPSPGMMPSAPPPPPRSIAASPAAGVFAAVGAAVSDGAFGSAHECFEAPEPVMFQRMRSVPKGAAKSKREMGDQPGQGADLLTALVRLQRANGRWELAAPLAEALGVPLATLQGVLAALPELGGKGDCVATLAALDALQRRLADREDEWRMLAAKAEAWLTAEMAGSPDLRIKVQDAVRKALEGA